MFLPEFLSLKFSICVSKEMFGVKFKISTRNTVQNQAISRSMRYLYTGLYVMY
jgi:hypothetical protein